MFISSPCFTPFSFNAPCQFTTLINLRSLVFGLKPFGSLRSVTVTPCLSRRYHFPFTLFIPEHAKCYRQHLAGVLTAFVLYLTQWDKNVKKTAFLNYAHFFRDATKVTSWSVRASNLVGGTRFFLLRNVQITSGVDQASCSEAIPGD